MSSQRRIEQEPAVEFHLLGQVDFDQCIYLQVRLIEEAERRSDGQINVLLCEHTPIISVGRGGSRGHIRMTRQELTSRRLSVRWTNRGGGCVFHGPGQLAIYPIVPLAWHGWSVGDYLKRINQALLGIIRELGFFGQTRPGCFGVWGRTGPLAVCGVSVKHEITSHGAFVNVNPSMDVVRRVDVIPPKIGESVRLSTMSCLVAEHGRPVKMTRVRAVTVEQFAMAFTCPRYHIYTGHPLLTCLQRVPSEPSARTS